MTAVGPIGDVEDGVVDELVILASPRSGTNYFCECLTAFREISGFYEIFNPAGVFGVGPRFLPTVNAILGLNAEKATDPDLRRTFRQQPLVALDALAKAVRARGTSMMSYKVFPRQLSPADMAALLAAERRHPVFIVRGRLDVYISLVKARAVKAWTNTNTADFLPEIDLDEFLEWAEHTDDWYGLCLDIARQHGKRFVVIRYESDIDVPREQMLPRIQRALALLDLEVELPEGVKRQRFQRQDKQAHPFEKIANGAELQAALRAAGKYDYALAAPLEPETSALV